MGVGLFAWTLPITYIGVLCLLSYVDASGLFLADLLFQPCDFVLVFIDELSALVLPQLYNFLGLGVVECIFGLVDSMMQFDVELIQSFVEIE